jgi:LysR family transcriptional regulator, benzoate and cis,cis-muconate-responsive activator of ben and cat genes
MKLHQLNYFIAVAEEGHVGRAAARLNLSQPPLTRQIQQLEVELGVKLFERHPNGMILTEAGTLFLDEARHALSAVDLAVDRVKRAGRGELGKLDIGIFGSAILGTIPRIIHQFRTQFPGIDVALHSMTKNDQLHGLRNRTIDVAFNRMVEPQSDIVIECICHEAIYLAVNTDRDLATVPNLKLGNLTHESFILFPTVGRPSFIEKTRGICHDLGFVPRVTQEVGDVMTGIALVASGFGLALVPESATSIAVPNVVYKPLVDLPDSAKVDLSCLYMSDNKSPIVERFLNAMRQFVACEAE